MTERTSYDPANPAEQFKAAMAAEEDWSVCLGTIVPGNLIGIGQGDEIVVMTPETARQLAVDLVAIADRIEKEKA